MFFHNDYGMNIGQRIRQERTAKGISRAELCRRADIKYPTLAGIENGDQTATTRLHAIANALSVSIGWLETGKGPKESAPPA
jgi:transcriptional regulator with XRE-family HTH domain